MVDADAIAHELTGPGGAAMPAIRAAFGAGVHRRGRRAGSRDGCAAIVFADPAAKRALEAILHPMIRAETERRAAAATGPT